LLPTDLNHPGNKLYCKVETIMGLIVWNILRLSANGNLLQRLLMKIITRVLSFSLSLVDF